MVLTCIGWFENMSVVAGSGMVSYIVLLSCIRSLLILFQGLAASRHSKNLPLIIWFIFAVNTEY